MGEKIIAFHGTAVWHQIQKQGFLDPSPEDLSYDEDEGALASCGGTYLAKSPEVTVPYALRASMEYCSDATVVMVEIDTDLLLPDEDRIATPFRRFLQDQFGRRWDDMSAKSLSSRIRGLKESDLEKISYAFPHAEGDSDRAILLKGLEAFALRSLEDGETDLKETAAAINEFCKAYREAISDEWADRMAYGRETATFRTFEAIGNSLGTRILGAATLVFDNMGLELKDVHVDGDFPEDVIDLLVEAAVDYYDSENIDIKVTYEGKADSSFAA